MDNSEDHVKNTSLGYLRERGAVGEWQELKNGFQWVGDVAFLFADHLEWWTSLLNWTGAMGFERSTQNSRIWFVRKKS